MVFVDGTVDSFLRSTDAGACVTNVSTLTTQAREKARRGCTHRTTARTSRRSNVSIRHDTSDTNTLAGEG